jgi:Ni,Fe-hydrogenase maturation factor
VQVGQQDLKDRRSARQLQLELAVDAEVWGEEEGEVAAVDGEEGVAAAERTLIVYNHPVVHLPVPLQPLKVLFESIALQLHTVTLH